MLWVVIQNLTVALIFSHSTDKALEKANYFELRRATSMVNHELSRTKHWRTFLWPGYYVHLQCYQKKKRSVICMTGMSTTVKN